MSTPARSQEYAPQRKNSLYLVRNVEGVSALLHSGPKPAHCGVHSHDQTRISLLLQGRICEVDDRGRYEDCGPLSLNLSPAGAPHAHKIQSATVLTLCADFSPEFLTRIAGSPNVLPEPTVFRRGPVVNAALRIHREMWEKDSASDLVLQGLFIELVGEMLRSSDRTTRVGAPSWLRRACELLKERCCDHLSIEEIANEVAVHPSHLTRTFRTYFGQTPGEYVRKLRLDRAAREVASTELSIQEIALRSGYSDHAHFSREFRKAMGMTPMEFRKSVHPL